MFVRCWWRWCRLYGEAGLIGVAYAPGVTRATADVTTTETTTSTSYTDLATSGPAVTITPGRSTDQFIAINAYGRCTTDGNTAHMSVAIAGAGAADVDSLGVIGTSGGGFAKVGAHALPTGVANGATHTAKYRTTAGTGSFANRRVSAFTLS